MEQAGELKQIKSKKELSEHLSKWEIDPIKCPIGFVLSLEGADSIVSIDHLYKACD